MYRTVPLSGSQAAQHICCLKRQEDRLCLIALCKLLHHLDIFLRKQIVGWIGTLANGLGNLLDGNSLSLCLANTSLSLALGTEYLLLLGSLSAVDGRSLLSLRLEDFGLLLSL